MAKIVPLLAAMLALSGCSTYPSKFKCGSTNGLGCTMLQEVNRQIDSGEIESVYAPKEKKCDKKKGCGNEVKTSVHELRAKASREGQLLKTQEKSPVKNGNKILF